MHLIGSLRQGGGAEKQLYNVARLLRDRFDISVIELAEEGHYGRLLREQGVRTFALGARGKGKVAAYLRLYRLLRGLGPDVLTCWISAANVVGTVIGRVAGVPRITTSVRCVDDWKGPLYLLLDRVIARLIDGVIVNSEDVREFVVTTMGIDRARTFLIHNAPDQALLRYAPAPDRRAALRAIFPDLADDVVLVTCARLHDEKRVMWLAEVFAALKARTPRVRLIMLGEGPQRAALERRIRDLGLEGDVALPGWREDVYDHLAGADIYVSVSVREGLSNALVEAQYLGLPCVVTDAGGNAEIMEDRVTGYLLDLQAPTEAVVGRIEELCRDGGRRRTFGEAAARRIRERFSAQATVQRYVDLYESLLRA